MTRRQHVFPRPTNKYPTLPKKLYRFRGFSRKRYIKEELAAAKSGMIRFSEPANFNDPYDCKTAIFPRSNVNPIPTIRKYMERGPCSSNDIHQYEDMLQQAQHGEEIDAISIYMQRIAISLTSRIACACFVEDWQNISMWNHYANGHSGACLEFTRDDKFEDPLIGGLAMSGVRISLDKVTYLDSPFLYHLEDLLKLYFNESAPENALADVSFFDFINNTFFRKSRHWEGEKEWRALLNYREDLSDSNSYSLFPGYSLTKVIIGPLAKEREVATIKNLCDVNDIPAFCTKLSHTKYGLCLFPAEMNKT